MIKFKDILTEAAGKRKVEKDIEKRLKQEKYRSTSNEKANDRHKAYYYAKLANKNKQDLTESNSEIVDYSKVGPTILVGLKTNLIRDMKDRYEFKEEGDNIYFFNKGKHFATLFDKGTPYQELKHDGSIDEYGWIKK